ncbi:type II toxin-antitoxin system RelE/ParE family toxin [Stenotrophomonas sp. ISL-67]|uniref:type II toxin-antitoxin system RelE/ParE family toxin n=1 Tax=Stenotrophomonas sp. ISL-67 TaxID=2819171 RepID=UPI001BECAE86|nr:type II toxin-antitoxin system RelE/ParE family toxin [Stenotrophomonas sp. ISL-67]
MLRNVLLLDSAKSEFKAIRQYVRKEFGNASWDKARRAFLDAIDLIERSPEMGSDVDELRGLGIAAFRSKLVGQTRIIYEFDDANVIIHMFIHTRRDFRTHLLSRVLGS